MTNTKLKAIIAYDPTATAGEVGESLQQETFYTVLECCGISTIQHDTFNTHSEAVDHLQHLVEEDIIIHGVLSDIAHYNYSIKEIK